MLLITMRIIFLVVATLVAQNLFAQSVYWKLTSGEISFLSEAPLELITASSDQVQGVIDTEERTFAFAVMISSFEGFNSPLQQQHFNENYLESGRFPKAIFKGRIIEKVDLQTNGVFSIRAKGMLSVHGIEQERIIKSTVTIQDNNLIITADFTVPLSDHNITIPRIVNQKIAEEIQVSIRAQMEQFRKS